MEGGGRGRREKKGRGRGEGGEGWKKGKEGVYIEKGLNKEVKGERSKERRATHSCLSANVASMFLLSISFCICSCW